MTREEMYHFLDAQNFSSKKTNKLSSVYFLINENGKTYPVYFISFDGAYFESMCQLAQHAWTEQEVRDFCKEQYVEECYEDALEYELGMYRDGVHYEIVNFQTEPWLTNIDSIEMLSEQECLDWLLRQRIC